KSGPERRSKIADIFGFLGYKPHIEVRYDISRLNFTRLEEIATRWQSGLFGDNNLEIINPRPLERMLEQHPDLIPEIRRVANEVSERSRGNGHFVLRADFGGRSSDHDFFERVQLLRRAELIRMRSVVVERLHEPLSLDLKLASSGELGIVTGFLGIASV